MNRRLFALPFACAVLAPLASYAQTAPPRSFSEAVEQVVRRPEFRHVSFGIEVYSLDEQKPLFPLELPEAVHSGFNHQTAH